ncbi:WG repeat-containing protein [Paenibacillus sp. PAMC21692]|uniref:WG repeat-containing protein n=1 Tax=Paenibacillus sp. PAMC21692 TaxID=2762320 RepID=UPI00164E62FD|nr:WG repeat-containing protein [Paenibacillus sp. PAMC21692]QNK60332.1 WG repeat-containing protein [Paenibacillus sp. PAMC21692]
MIRKWIAALTMAAMIGGLMPGIVQAEAISYQISPQYDSGSPFVEGMASVKKDGKSGYIDSEGNPITAFKYDFAHNFKDGLAVVGVKSGSTAKFGIINRQGKELTELIYDDAIAVGNGYGVVRVLGKSDNVWVDGKAGLVGPKGIIAPPIYEEINPPSDGTILVKKDGKYGYLDAAGKKLTDLIYNHAYVFSDGYGLVYTDKEIGFVDTQGKLVYARPSGTSSYSDFSEGLAKVSVDGKYGYIDTYGTMVIAPKYDEAWFFNQGLSYVTLNGKSGYIDRAGKEVVPLKYDEVSTSFRNGLALVANGEDYIPQSSEGEYFGNEGNKDYVVLSNKKFGFVNGAGKEVVSLQYDYAEEFVRGYARVSKGGTGAGSYYHGGKFGYIDTAGREVVPLRYDYVGGDMFDSFRGFTEGLSPVSNGGTGTVFDYSGGLWGYVNAQGVEVTPLKYTYVWSFNEGMGRVEQNGKYGFVNASGQEIIPPIYDDAGDFYNGFAEVSKGGKRGYVDVQGNEVTGMIYSDSRRFLEGTALVQESSSRKLGFLRNPLPQVEPVVIRVASQGAGKPSTVTLSSGTANAVIYYTLNGGDPLSNLSNSETQEYTAPFAVGKSVKIQAIAVAKGMQMSPLAAMDYKQTYVKGNAAVAPAPGSGGNGESQSGGNGSTPSNTGAGFTDTQTHWAKLTIQWAVDQKIVSGYPDATFRPNKSVSEPEFLKMLLGAFPDIKIEAAQNGAAWHTPYFKAAAQYNWPLLQEADAKGFNRGQVARLLAGTQGFSFEQTKDAVQYVLDLSIAGGKTSRTVEGFAVNDPLTRAEAITLIQNMKERAFKLSKADNAVKAAAAEFQVRGLIIGDTEQTLLAKLGQPARKDVSEYGFQWYIYNQDYANYVQVGIQSGRIVGFYTTSDNWSSARGIKLGSGQEDVAKRYGTGTSSIYKEEYGLSVNLAKIYEQDESYVTLFMDKFNNNRVTSLQIIAKPVEDGMKELYAPETAALKKAFALQSLDLVNATRTRYGLPVLQWDEAAARVAEKHSEDMREQKYFAHISPQGQEPDGRFDDAGIAYGTVGENIAADQRSIIYAHEGWMNSEGHRRAILGPWERLGVGIAFNAGNAMHPMDKAMNMYYTQNFYSRKGVVITDQYEELLQKDKASQAAKELEKQYPFHDQMFELYVLRKSLDSNGQNVNYYGVRNIEAFTLPPYSAIYITAGTSMVRFEDDYYNYHFGGKLVVANHSSQPRKIKAGELDYTNLDQIYRSSMGTVTGADGTSTTLTPTGPYVRLIQFSGDFDETIDYKTYVEQKEIVSIRPWVTVKGK